MYGLAAAIFSQNISRALRTATRVQAGALRLSFLLLNSTYLQSMYRYRLGQQLQHASLASTFRRIQAIWYRTRVGRIRSQELHQRQDDQHQLVDAQPSLSDSGIVVVSDFVDSFRFSVSAPSPFFVLAVPRPPSFSGSPLCQFSELSLFLISNPMMKQSSIHSFHSSLPLDSQAAPSRVESLTWLRLRRR